MSILRPVCYELWFCNFSNLIFSPCLVVYNSKLLEIRKLCNIWSIRLWVTQHLSGYRLSLDQRAGNLWEVENRKKIKKIWNIFLSNSTWKGLMVTNISLNCLEKSVPTCWLQKMQLHGQSLYLGQSVTNCDFVTFKIWFFRHVWWSIIQSCFTFANCPTYGQLGYRSLDM